MFNRQSRRSSIVANQSRLQYLGYQKLREQITLRDQVFRSPAISGSFKVAGKIPGLTVEGARNWDTVGLSLVESLNEPAFLAGEAVRITSEIGRICTPSTPDTDFRRGCWYEIAGSSVFAIRFHDDFREPGPDSAKPRVALWLVEIEDVLPLADGRRSVTWVLLTGTADGNYTELYDGAIPASRAGSQTEGLFEDLFCWAHGSPRVGGDSRFLDGYWTAAGARSMLADGEYPTEIESLFRCLAVRDVPVGISADEFLTIEGWSPSSRSEWAVVRRVVLGTPILVQNRE